MSYRSHHENFQSADSASAGKIFIGGLHKETTLDEFNKHFEKYGEVTDSVIMKDRNTGMPRGFGFVTFADPFVVDKVIEDKHILNGKQVEIKRTIPKGSAARPTGGYADGPTGGNLSRNIKTKKIFVGGIPPTVTEDEFKDVFAKYGNIAEHQIIRDHETNKSRGFGFVIFDSEEVVDELLSKGNKIDMANTKVEIKKAEPKKTSIRSPPVASYPSRDRSFSNSYGGPYGGYVPPPGPIRSHGGPGHASRFAGGPYGGYGPYGRGIGGPEFLRGYDDVYGLGGYRNEPPPYGYPSRYGPYASGFGGEGYARGGPGYGGPGYGGSFEAGAPYEGAGGPYGRGYSSGSRYHPYAR